MRRVVVIAVLCSTIPAFGWGPEGHNLVARLAAAHLTPAAAARVAGILGPGVSMQSISSWPDEIRRQRQATGPWHYIDIPIDKPHLDMARDCPKGDCILAKIADFRKVLDDPATTPVDRKEAIMFLIHFVGDMHQPLHCSDNEDKGGNNVEIDLFGAATNLHSTWDSGLLKRMGTEESLYERLNAELTNKRAKSWGKGTVESWAEQSHKAAQKVVYGKLPKAAAGATVKIDAAYQKRAEPLIREQLERAGARLAAVLNGELN